VTISVPLFLFRELNEQFFDRAFGGIGDGEFAAGDVELAFGIDADASEQRVEQVAVIDLAVGDGGTVVVCLADAGAALNSRAAEQHAPGSAPVIAAVAGVD